MRPQPVFNLCFMARQLSIKLCVGILLTQLALLCSLPLQAPPIQMPRSARALPANFITYQFVPHAPWAKTPTASPILALFHPRQRLPQLSRIHHNCHPGTPLHRQAFYLHWNLSHCRHRHLLLCAIQASIILLSQTFVHHVMLGSLRMSQCLLGRVIVNCAKVGPTLAKLDL